MNNQIREVDKTKPIFGLFKIPLEAIVKYQDVELGKLRSYIDELEYNLQMLEKPYTDEDSKKLDIAMRLFHRLPLSELEKIEESVIPVKPKLNRKPKKK